MRESANDHLLKEIYSAQQTNKHGPANSVRAGHRVPHNQAALACAAHGAGQHRRCAKNRL